MKRPATNATGRRLVLTDLAEVRPRRSPRAMTTLSPALLADLEYLAERIRRGSWRRCSCVRPAEHPAPDGRCGRCFGELDEGLSA